MKRQTRDCIVRVFSFRPPLAPDISGLHGASIDHSRKQLKPVRDPRTESGSCKSDSSSTLRQEIVTPRCRKGRCQIKKSSAVGKVTLLLRPDRTPPEPWTMLVPSDDSREKINTQRSVVTRPECQECTVTLSSKRSWRRVALTFLAARGGPTRRFQTAKLRRGENATLRCPRVSMLDCSPPPSTLTQAVITGSDELSVTMGKVTSSDACYMEDRKIPCFAARPHVLSQTPDSRHPICP